jgi:hypothetical protein
MTSPLYVVARTVLLDALDALTSKLMSEVSRGESNCRRPASYFSGVTQRKTLFYDHEIGEPPTERPPIP